MKLTVVLLNIDRTDCIIEHVEADDARPAYELALKRLYDDSEPAPEEYPFDLAQAESDRPLLAVFPGHLIAADNASLEESIASTINGELAGAIEEHWFASRFARDPFPGDDKGWRDHKAALDKLLSGSAQMVRIEDCGPEPEALTWFDASAKLNAGDAVRFVTAWEAFPDFVVPVGTLGIVTENGLNEMQPALLVQTTGIRGAASWNNVVQLHGPADHDHERPDSDWHKPCPVVLVAARDAEGQAHA